MNMELLQQARDALTEAIDDLQDWAAYASDYFREKHDFAGALREHKAVLAELDQALAQEPKRLTDEQIKTEQIGIEPNFETALSNLLNCYSMENVSNTPDFILAEFMMRCLMTFNTATKRRDDWFGIAAVLGGKP
jgi:hypothetical protein